MIHARRLTLAHFWVAFIAFAAAAVLGAWQMWARSPLAAPADAPETYYLSVTAHGVSMAYVLPTFLIMGFGYFVAETALGRDLPWVRPAWAAYVLGVIGTIMAVVTVMTGHGWTLYTFYPPLTASVFYYIGLVLVVVGSWVWCAIMIVAMVRWKRDNPGRPVPLAMFATVATQRPRISRTMGGAVVSGPTAGGPVTSLGDEHAAASTSVARTIDARPARECPALKRRSAGIPAERQGRPGQSPRVCSPI